MNQSHQKSPSGKYVIDAVSNLLTSGLLAQENGMLYLDVDNNWIVYALDVLRDYGYIRPPSSGTRQSRWALKSR